MFGTTALSWVSEPGLVYERKHVRDKYDPEVDEVNLLHANQNHAVVRYPEGREVTVLVRGIAPTATTPSNWTWGTLLCFLFNQNWLGIDMLPLVRDLKRVMSAKLKCRPR